MGRDVSPPIAEALTQERIREYRTNGAICLKGVIESSWLELLSKGVEKNLAHPGSQSRIYTKDRGDKPGFFFGDVARWREIDEYRHFIFHSPAAEIAAVLTGARAINIYFDGVFVREANTPSRTPWHQDVPYWPIDGDQLCSIWIPLDYIPRAGSVEYVKGSHLWGHVYKPKSFFEANEDYDFNDRVLKLMPDFDKQEDQHELLGWEMYPGDVQCFHGHVIHGSGGNQTSFVRRTFQVRWAGDDMTYRIPEGEMHPTFPDCGLEPGDKIGGPVFPEVWRSGVGLVCKS